LVVGILAVLGVGVGWGDVIRARVIHVADGDTFTVLWNGEPRVIRIRGIDAPETGQPFGTKAAWALKTMVLDRTVTLRTYEQDRYGRTIADVECGGVNVALSMVEQGLAYHYVRYSDDPALALAEQNARRNRMGLWSQSSPVPPWEYREQQRSWSTTLGGSQGGGTVETWILPSHSSSWTGSGTIPVPPPGKEVYVRGYYRKDGTYVEPHWRSKPGKGK